MLNAIIDDAVWSEASRLLPPPKSKQAGTGRHRMNDRAVLAGIVLVLRTGMAWEHLPSDLGLGSGMTCLRRLREWQRDGVWGSVRDLLASRLCRGDRVPWWRADAGGGVAGALLRKQSRARWAAPPLLRLVHSQPL